MRAARKVLLVFGLTGCGDPGQERAQIALFVTGTSTAQSIGTAGGVLVTVDRAELAFGPLYLCAGTQAGELCDTARLEWLGSTVIDLASDETLFAGELTGVTGPVRSWMYDLGISLQLTETEPHVLEAAAALGGASFRIAGTAQRGLRSVPFSAAIAIQQEDETELGVPVVRKSSSDVFSHQVTTSEAGLLVRFDLEQWLSGLDFSGYLAAEPCAVGGPALACDGAVERTCNADGTALSSRDCTEIGQSCVANVGCAAELTLSAHDQGYRALRNAIVAGARPQFEWDFRPTATAARKQGERK